MTRPHSFLSLFLLPSLALGQWSSNANHNLAVADSPGDQVLVKVAPTSNGGCYVSWLDGANTGYDVRLQRLDVAGNELWGHNGVLVADRQVNSAQDYGLALDLDGHALLAYRANHGAAQDEIVASRVTPDGDLVWGLTGSLVSGNTSAFVATPKISAIGTRGILVAWTEDSAVVASGLNAKGAVAWTYRHPQGPTESRTLSDLHRTGNTAILSMVAQTSGPLSPLHLHALQLDASGQTTWPAPLSVFDGGELQAGVFPTFTPDGVGGGLFAWHSASPFQCFVQHVRSDGTEAFPHNGVPVSTNATQVRLNPALDHDAFGGSSYVFWEERDTSQTLFGLSGQKFDESGQRQWAPAGETLIPLGTTEIRNVRTVANPGGAFVFWTEISGLGTDVLRGRHVDGAGVTDVGPFDVASVPSIKNRPSAALGDSGHALISWSDKRTDAGDILIQNVNGNGLLGNSPLGSALCFGVACPCANDESTAGCTNSSGQGATLMAVGTTSVSADNLLLLGAQMPANQTAILFAGPGLLGGGTGQPFGGGLLCVTGAIWRLGTIQSDGSGHGSWGPGLIESTPWVSAGNVRALQAWFRDTASGSCSAGFNTSHALSLGFGQ